jgi:uncharacterized membrane protein
MIDNPLQMNDWGIKHFLKVVLVVQLVMLGLVGLSTLGFGIPVLTQIVGLIYLAFIPGIIILRILRLHRLGTVRTLLYSVGLSLAFIMFLGLFMNSVYPHIGIDKPISAWPLMGTMTIALLILSFVAHKRDKGFSTPTQFNWHQILSPPVLFLISLPLLSVLGTQMVNIYHSNILLLTLITLVALLPILVLFTKFIPHRLYPLAVITIALALLYHWVLISNYLVGYDIHCEYYFANLVITNSLWDATITNLYNAMLSVSMLAPSYSIICGMELTWVFKVIYPLIYSLVPLGIYKMYSQQVGSKVAFLAAFFFMSILPFFMDIPTLARQQIAELFLVLILLEITSKSTNRLGRIILCLVFSTSMIVSHYSVSYFFMFSLFIVLLILFLSQRISAHGLSKGAKSAKAMNRRRHQIAESNSSVGNGVITLSFTAFYVVACLSWYMWQSGSSTLITIVELTNHIATTFFTEFLSSMSSQALWLITTPTVSPLHEVSKYLHLVTQFLIAVGIIDLVFHWRQKKFGEEFSAFSLVGLILLIAAIAVPYFSIAINTPRLYHLSLIFLAPFCVTGAIATSRFLLRKRQPTSRLPLKLVSILLAVFLLFNTGFMYEVANDHPYSISLSQEEMKRYESTKVKASFYGFYTPDEDVFSAKWLSKHVEIIRDIKVYATEYGYGQIHALESYGMISSSRVTPLNNSTQEVESGAYIYLQYLNVVDGIGTMTPPPLYSGIKREEYFNMLELNPLLEKANKVYSNRGSEILLVP